ncbi:MAG: hypothetical protein CO030_03620 [Candidatus Magasanikbacteria bacterium CG_4_9_14_0_2_um_filter_42_11]|uniref:DUF2188 domain-containing protein n=1 Tax=Candidatus Magasanikbacteria bacterium CG_4_9_14_0_2_um_filter_42_11 TaxID=1974643 RepID=A0A2M8F972_9BACT|nr:MAG: hypothetical protein COU34_00100 [Candidatus Magasanikbacteria bacterium CG10_big_fil_rev_8_21_14_0_10_43_9]PIY92180.1 MAG: hypothetical protein COY70_04645 [Candidatus Magasanikbacteria bacterium CG_4_10_14_0_8_um_filter_42_12]PJC52295.1 MAG: hypothetical protein CO030_03620 [Candidatus Magasanikbacteria bacterium CG_4_9_14_0_2_um_filter_42_11]
MKKRILTPKKPHNASLQAYTKAVQRGRKGIHVVKNENGWAVKKIGNVQQAIFSTQKEAETHALRQKKNGNTVYVHGRDGRIKRVT